MGERIASGESTPFTADEDTAIRERVRELTSQVLQHGRVDTEAVKDVVRAVAGGSSSAVGSDAEANEPFADTVRSLGDGLQKSAAAAHDALQQLASRGADFTDNDLKDVLISLRVRLETHPDCASRRVSSMMEAA